MLYPLRNTLITVCENYRKSLIQHCERSELTFWVDKSSLKMPKMANLAIFKKPKVCGLTLLPDRSILIGQKLVENAKIRNENETF